MSSISSKVEQLDKSITSLINSFIEQDFETGAQTVLYLNGEKVIDINCGAVSSSSTQPVKSDTLFPVCSTSKGITATLMHILAQMNLLDYEKRVTDYWPEFGSHGKDKVTVRQALAHMAGIPQRAVYDSFDEICDWAQACQKIADLTTKWEPGSTAEYHSFNWGWMAGRIAEGATGKKFSELLKEFITAPLGIEKELYFGTDDESETRVSPFEAQPQQKEQITTAQTAHQCVREVPGPLMEFDNMPQVRRACMPAVNGIMSAGAIAKVYAAAIGKVDGVRLLGERQLDAAVQLQTPPNVMPKCFGHGMGLGYVLKGTAENPGTFFGHGGAGGSEGMANRKLGYTVGFTKNRMDTHLDAPGHLNRLILQKIIEAFGTEGDGGFYTD